MADNSVLSQIERLNEDLGRAVGRTPEIDISQIDPDPEQARHSLREPNKEELAALEELADSIRSEGVINPIVVWENPTTNRYILVAGERRWRAAQLAGLARIPANILPAAQTAPERRAAIALIENLQRRDLTPLEVGTALAAHLERTGLNNKQLAKILGKDPSWISRHLSLLRSTGPVLEALREGLLVDPNTASIMKGLPLAQQKRLLADARKQNVVISRAEADRAAKRSAPAARDTPPATPTTVTVRLSVAQLAALLTALGMTVPDDPAEAATGLLTWLSTRLEKDPS